ncbi:MAG: aldo/keto reductase [Anaerovoracaceae bacterium]
MQYRTFAPSGEKISLLGFGTMRLPVMEKDETVIDEAEAIRMIRYAIDKGVNYMDTAYMYHGGTSEEVLGKALKDGYREKVFLADKMPIWMAKKAGGIEALFEEQFRRLDVEYIDFYLVHNLTESMWKKCKDANLMPFLEEMKAKGRIGKIGFSFHDELDVFKDIINDYPWEFCQIQLNYMDTELQAGVAGLKYAGEKGLPVIIMEPLKGGKLTKSIPESVKAVWNKSPIKRTPAEWALQWLADFPEVLTILSGMSEMEEVKENVRILGNATPGSITETEKQLIREASAEYNNLIKASCTGCKYCMPCPKEIDIPEVMEQYNQWHMFKAFRTSLRQYNFLPQGMRPLNCIDCKACEAQCPQSLPISDIMREMGDTFEG